MKPSKVLKKETYINDNGVKIYAEHRLEHNDVMATVVFADDNWHMMKIKTILDFEEFVENNDFELINK